MYFIFTSLCTKNNRMSTSKISFKYLSYLFEIFIAIKCYYSDWFSLYFMYNCQLHLDFIKGGIQVFSSIDSEKT